MGSCDPGECLKHMTATAGWLRRSMVAIQRMSRLCCFIKFESLHKIFESCSVQTQSWFFSQELFLLMVTFIFWRHLSFFLTSITFQFLFYCYFKQCCIVNFLKRVIPFPQNNCSLIFIEQSTMSVFKYGTWKAKETNMSCSQSKSWLLQTFLSHVHYHWLFREKNDSKILLLLGRVQTQGALLSLTLVLYLREWWEYYQSHDSIV